VGFNDDKQLAAGEQMKLCEKNARTRASESFERSRMLETGFLESVSHIRGENTQAREELSQRFRRRQIE
jgi:hypothetical protein